jgi:hypothetical protein
MWKSWERLALSKRRSIATPWTPESAEWLSAAMYP